MELILELSKLKPWKPTLIAIFNKEVKITRWIVVKIDDVFSKTGIKNPILIQPDLPTVMKTFCGRCQKKSYSYVDNESSLVSIMVSIKLNFLVTRSLQCNDYTRSTKFVQMNYTV